MRNNLLESSKLNEEYFSIVSIMDNPITKITYDERIRSMYKISDFEMVSIKEKEVSLKYEEKIMNRIEELSNYFVEETSEVPNKHSKKFLLEFLKNINYKKIPSITLSPSGNFSIRWIDGPNKIVLNFHEKKYIEYLILLNEDLENQEIHEGMTKEHSFIKCFHSLINKIIK